MYTNDVLILLHTFLGNEVQKEIFDQDVISSAESQLSSSDSGGESVSGNIQVGDVQLLSEYIKSETYVATRPHLNVHVYWKLEIRR